MIGLTPKDNELRMQVGFTLTHEANHQLIASDKDGNWKCPMETLGEIMNKIDLIIDALDGITNGNYNPRLAKEALAAARELKALKPSEPVAWITKGGKGELWWHQSVDENGDNNPKDVPLYAKEQS